MMSLASQMYDYYVRPYLGEKGQDLVEYALLLAIVVAIGWLIYNQIGLKDSIQKIFENASQVIKEPLLWQEFFGKAVNRRLTVFPKNLMNERRNQHE